jgi:hypothetical protein
MQPLIEALRRHPGMFMRSVTYENVVIFIDGYDTATSGGLLVGFHEWLIVRANDGANVAWSVVVLDILRNQHGGTDDASLIEGLFSLFDEYNSVRASYAGLRRIYVVYDEWLRRQDWYTPDSPGWFSRDVDV